MSIRTLPIISDVKKVVSSIVEGGDIIQPLTERILGRVIAEPIFNLDGEEVYPIGHLIDEDLSLIHI